MTAGLIAEVTMAVIAVCGAGLVWAGMAWDARLAARLSVALAGASLAVVAVMDLLGEWDMYSFIQNIG